MDFHAIKYGQYGILRSSREVRDGFSDPRLRQWIRAMHLVGEGTFHRDVAARDQTVTPFCQELRVGRATQGPKLQKYIKPLLLKCGREFLPSSDLIVAVDSRNVGVTTVPRADDGGLGDDERSRYASTLLVVFLNRRQGKVRNMGAKQSHWGHGDALVERYDYDLERRE